MKTLVVGLAFWVVASLPFAGAAWLIDYWYRRRITKIFEEFRRGKNEHQDRH